MVGAPSRCTLCPAGCALHLAAAGPDAWKIEYPREPSSGACPRGSCLGELIGHRRRILTPAHRSNGQWAATSLSQALRDIIHAADDGDIAILLDGNIPCEQLLAAATWCRAWPRAKLCFVIEQADEQLLMGTEAGEAEYLANDQLAACDGFIIIGDAFAANPACSRGVFDRRKAESGTPIVVIDPAAGTCTKFATHRAGAGVGMEFAALWQLALAAGVDVSEDETGFKPMAPETGQIASAADAGKALATCRRVGVLVAAEYGRGAPWRQIGYLAARIARALGGGVAPQTVGANALAAVRLGAISQTVSLAEVLSTEGAGAAGSKPATIISIGCDVLGMLGWGCDGHQPKTTILAAAAALPNATTQAAELVLPVTMTGEHAGTFLLDGAKPTGVSALLGGPAGVLSPAELVAALACEAGVQPPEDQAAADLTERLVTSPVERLVAGPPGPAPATSGEQSGPLLILQRNASW